MKKLIILACLMVCTSPLFGATAMNLPEPSVYVTDTIHLLKPETIQEVNRRCKEFDSIAQIAVCIVDSTDPYTIEQYGIKLAEKWKVGYKGKDNGVIFILAKSDRKIRIEVGRGLEGVLTDAKSGRIIRNEIAPRFKVGKWDEGILVGVSSIQHVIDGGEPSDGVESSDDSMPWWLLSLIIFFIVVLIVIVITLVVDSDGYYGGGGGYIGGGSSSGGGGSSSGGGFGGGFSGGGASGGF